VAKTVTLSVESESFAEGGFRKAYKCESIDGKLSGKWVLKKYKENALEDMKSVNLTEEEHARKQVHMHIHWPKTLLFRCKEMFRKLLVRH
jgi:hypothetical protein